MTVRSFGMRENQTASKSREAGNRREAGRRSVRRTSALCMLLLVTLCGCSGGRSSDATPPEDRDLFLIGDMRRERVDGEDRTFTVWGYMTVRGSVVVRPQFRDARAFSEGRAAVREDGLWGYIDGRGKFIVRPKYTRAYPFSNGLGRVNMGSTYHRLGGVGWFGGKWGFVDRSGRLAIPLRTCRTMQKFSCGLAAVHVQTSKHTWKWGYIDTSGKMVIPPQFDETWGFYEDLATVSVFAKGGRYVIDKTGKRVVDAPGARFGEALYPSGHTYVDIIGRTVIRLGPEVLGGKEFSEGLAAVRNRQDKWGYIDKTGKVVIPAQYAQAWSFREGLALVQTKAERLQFIDKKGKVVIALGPEASLSNPRRFSRTGIPIYGFRNGLVLVDGPGFTLRYIDKRGRKVFQFEVEHGATYGPKIKLW